MTEKHTPLPWRANLVRTLIHIGNANNGVCAISLTPPRIPEREMRDAMIERAKADAALIVRSVNALPELVRVLKLAREHIDACDYDAEAIALVEDIDTALAKVKQP